MYGTSPRHRLFAHVAPALALLLGCEAKHVLGEVDESRPSIAVVASPCGPLALGDNLNVCTATYLPGSGTKATSQIVIGNDRSVIVTGLWGGQDLGAATTSLPQLGGSGQGTLWRLRPDGREPLSVSRLGDAIDDVAVEPRTGDLFVLGRPFGIARLSPDGRDRRWAVAATGQRVAVGAGGLVAVLSSEPAALVVLDGEGQTLGRFPVPRDKAIGTDVAVHGESRTIVVTGRVPTGATSQPFLSAFSPSGESRWTGYGWSEAEITARGLRASTRGIAVSMGADGNLYYLGDSHGGNTTHSYDPRNLGSKADNRSVDPYDSPYDTAQYILYWARFAPPDGAFQGGKFLLTREMNRAAGSGGSGESIFPESIAADEKGNVLVGGQLRCCIQGAAKKQIRDLPVTSREPDAFFVLFAADRARRLLWTTLGGTGVTTAVAMRRGVAAAVSLQDRSAVEKGRLITVDALLPQPLGGETDTHLVVFPAPL